jgi:hypothetical protein
VGLADGESADRVVSGPSTGAKNKEQNLVAPQGADDAKEQKLPPNVIRFAPQGARKPKAPKTKKKSPGAKRTGSPGSSASDWVKSLLPGTRDGWWDVAENGKGFKIHFRWRDGSKQLNLPFPRISAEQFQRLKEATNERAKFLIADRIYGHIEDLCSPGSARIDRARTVAARIGFALGNHLDALQANSEGRRA